MASIARRPDGTYRPRYRDEHGKEHARHFKRKVDAQRWLDEVTAAVQTGTYVDPKRARTTVGELAPVWLAGKINLKPTSRARYADVLKTHVLPRWGNVALIRVTHGDVQAWLSELSDRGLAGASVRKAQGVLWASSGSRCATGAWPSTPRSAWHCPRCRRSAAGT